MPLNALLTTLAALPAVVTRLHAIRAAAQEFDEIDYAGADILLSELDNALEALDGAPGALLYLAGVTHAGGTRRGSSGGTQASRGGSTCGSCPRDRPAYPERHLTVT
jgi:hypothetical protein